MIKNKKQFSRWILFAGLIVLGLGNTAVPLSATNDYVGAKRCRVCHLAESKAWEQTKMAKAFEVLQPGAAADRKKSVNYDPNKDYTKDEFCLGCHATGYGKGGFKSMEATPDLAGVTCEACHGPGGGFVKPNLMSLTNKEFKLADVQAAGLILPKDGNFCQTNCHNEKSPFVPKGEAFDFEARKAQGVHQIVALRNSH
jgi:cytochrome c554/c'-like protein